MDKSADDQLAVTYPPFGAVVISARPMMCETAAIDSCQLKSRKYVVQRRKLGGKRPHRRRSDRLCVFPIAATSAAAQTVEQKQGSGMTPWGGSKKS